jgi:type II secretion system protein N
MAEKRGGGGLNRFFKELGKGFLFFLFYLISLPLFFLPYIFPRRWPWFKKFHAYSLFFLAGTFLFTYLTLPFEKIKDRVLRIAGDKLGMEIVGKVQKDWFTGIKASSLRFIPRANPGEKVQEMEVDEMTARVSLLPLFLGRLKVGFSAKLGNGTVEGSLAKKLFGTKAIEGVDAKIQEVDLKPLVLLHKFLGRTLGGTISGVAHLELGSSSADMNGKVDVTVENTKVPSFQAPTAMGPLTLPELSLGQVRANVDFADGAAIFKDVKISGGQDLEASIEGYAVLQEMLARTTVRAYAKFRFSDGFFQRNAKFDAIIKGSLAGAMRPDGWAGYLIEGPIGMPSQLRRTPMAQPPPNLTPPTRAAGGPPMPSPAPPRPGRPNLGDLQRRLGGK